VAAEPSKSRGGRFPMTYMTAEGKAIKEAYQWEAKAQWKDKPTTEPLCVAVRFYFKIKLRRDLDNQNKLVFDALSRIVYEDDSQIDEFRLYRRFDKDEPRIEVQIEELTL
jgi:Holliday junction resolvase RusA-like endonuclease